MWPAVAGNRRSTARVRSDREHGRSGGDARAGPGDRGMAPRRRRRQPPLLHLRHRPRFRPRLRRDAARRHVGVRDVGRARRRRVECRAAVPCLDGRQPRRGPRRTRASDARLVGRLRRTGQADRHGSLVRRVLQRPRRLSGHDRAGVAVAGGRQAVRISLSRDHDPRHGARPGAPRRSSRHRSVAHGDRWLDGRHAGPRVGRHVPAAGAWPRADRRLHAGDGAADRLGQHRPAGRSRSIPAGAAATTTTPRQAMDPATASPSPAWSRR